jgi:hypothetical protein
MPQVQILIYEDDKAYRFAFPISEEEAKDFKEFEWPEGSSEDYQKGQKSIKIWISYMDSQQIT